MNYLCARKILIINNIFNFKENEKDIYFDKSQMSKIDERTTTQAVPSFEDAHGNRYDDACAFGCEGCYYRNEFL